MPGAGTLPRSGSGTHALPLVAALEFVTEMDGIRMSGGVAARPAGQDVQRKVGGAEVEPLRQIDRPDAAGEGT